MEVGWWLVEISSHPRALQTHPKKNIRWCPRCHRKHPPHQIEQSPSKSRSQLWSPCQVWIHEHGRISQGNSLFIFRTESERGWSSMLKKQEDFILEIKLLRLHQETLVSAWLWQALWEDTKLQLPCQKRCQRRRLTSWKVWEPISSEPQLKQPSTLHNRISQFPKTSKRKATSF